MANPASAKPGAGSKSDLPPVVIKKYANRRLYNTETSSYITLEHLAQMTREGRDFQVFDARSGEEITRSVLTQIVMDEEAGGKTMLPVSFLRQIIAMYGDSMQSMVPQYLEASMDAFAENQNKFRDAALKPFEHLTRQNLAMFQAAAGMLNPARGKGEKPGAHAAQAQEDGAVSGSELDALKAQLAALQARLDSMDRK
ncbi:polyhydroxyalkanoate synthesis repressor PhaR [Sandarakinorhabdus sp.]|uniref:polyhydroxyalkanoate synthesis repressor PhaR n=1 Tax=Sandarakinorhabdus sp. TaxID=1916663 RepID=UPI00286E9016|nr:polyhydroxyalkanoate synthesis repressor PhaR [Sandarakinorhabdus sp.]